MKTERTESSTRKRLNGAKGSIHAARTRGEVIARDVQRFASAFPASLREQLEENPYRALGIAVAVGAGAGIVLGSRILRTALSSAASFAIVELGRSYLLSAVKDELDTPADAKAS